ncbi:hypothetical protein [Azohydromonas australica]|uniref:hypothetical protein n=1 Tax=Azohydromonas australica TaxID=364039 RepID=UPI00048B6A70|nr:hypothetical protein [Azohydromonas australica]
MSTLAEPLHALAEPCRSAAASSHLSAFEVRCLLKRIADLREQAQLAVLGADAARDAVPARALEGICQALHQAEQQIAHAEDLAARQLD